MDDKANPSFRISSLYAFIAVRGLLEDAISISLSLHMLISLISLSSASEEARTVILLDHS